MMPDLPKKSLFQGRGRKLTVLALFLSFIVCAWMLGGMPAQPEGSSDGFLSAAFHPTLHDQSQSLPADATPFPQRILNELGTTLRYAIIAMSLAVPAGILLGFFASTTWWPTGAGGKTWRPLLAPIRWSVRILITLMRSIHELIWAILFLAALGHEPITACVAIALPFTGTLAKVFSEIIDEQSPEARNQLTASGASPIQAFFASLFPQALPDMATYTLYRFECALRSSAVLGFIGIETIGLSIRRSFENNFYNELWTELYALLIVILCVDALGSQLRKRLNTIPIRKKSVPPSAYSISYIKQLKRTAPRWKLTRALLWATLALILISWSPSLLGINAANLTSPSKTIDRTERLAYFFTKITPSPVRESGSWSEVIPWASDLWKNNGHEALINTLAMATAAIALSAFAAWCILPWGSRVLASNTPLGVTNGKANPFSKWSWRIISNTVRMFFVVSRAIPEYIYAYLLIGMLGISAWPLVFALALHNFGILGRLWGEVIENQPPAPARQLRHTGGSRLQCYIQSYLPLSFNRFLMYLFYRWETCVREATVLGMLGFASLGLQIQLARNFSRAYDEMLFYVLLGSAVIFIGDILSLYLRRALLQD